MVTRLRRNVFQVGMALILSASVVLSADGKKPAAEGKKKRPQKANPALAHITDTENLPRVLLIGDSISIGYTIPTRKLLEGKVNLHRIPINGGPTSRGVQSIDKWIGTEQWNVIHFNWGLHDLKKMPDGKYQVPLEEYGKNLETLVAKLKKTGAKLIWASTTPVPEGKMTPPRSNSDVITYNEAAKGIMDANGIAIDDLYAFAFPKLAEIQMPANVHFSGSGSKALAERVAKSIEAALQ